MTVPQSAGLCRLSAVLFLVLAIALPAAAQSPPPAATAADSSHERVRLARLERWVMERNPSLWAAERAWASTRERASQAGALDDPMADLMLAPVSISDRDVNPAWRVGLSQDIPLGKRSARRAAAEFEAEAERGAFHATAERLLHDTRLAFAEYAMAESSLAINREVAGLFEDQRRTGLARYAAGLVGQADPLQAELELGRLEHEAIIHRRQLDLARARLNQLLGGRAEDPLPPPDWHGATAELEAALDSIETRGLEPRGTLRQARATLAGAGAKVRLARRERWPDLELSVAYDRFWSEPELRPVVGVSLRLPIQRDRLAAAEREARASYESARYQEEAARIEYDFDVESARLRVEEARHEIELFDRTMLPVSARGLVAARAGYETGRNDVATWIAAARDAAAIRLAAFDAHANHLRALADLLRALGDRGAIEEDRP